MASIKSNHSLIIGIIALSLVFSLPAAAKIQVGLQHPPSIRSLPDADIIVQNGHSGDIRAVSTDPSGRYIISGGSDRTVRIWSFQSGKLLKILRGHMNEIAGVVFHPGGNFIVSGDLDKTIIIWNLRTGKIQRTVHLPEMITLNSLILDPMGKSIIVGGQGSIAILDFDSGKLKKTIVSPEKIGGYLGTLAVDPKGRFLAAPGNGGNINIWRLDTGEYFKTLKGHTRGVNALAISPSGDLLASGSDDKTIRLWQLPSGKQVKTLEGYDAAILSLAFDPTGQTIVSGYGNGRIVTWDVRSGLTRNSIQAHYAAVNTVAVDPTGRSMVTGSSDKTIKVGDLMTGELLRTLGEDWASVDSITTNHTGDMVIAGYTDRSIRIWDLRSVKLSKVLKGHDALVSALAVDSNDRYLASGSWDATVRVWDLHSGALMKTLRGHTERVNAVTFDPSGRYLASASDDWFVYVWDIQKGGIVTRLNGHTDKVKSVVIDPSGRTVISCGFDKTIRIWDLKTGKIVKVLDKFVQSKAFRDFGRRYAAAVQEGERTHKRIQYPTGPDFDIVKRGRVWHTSESHQEEIIALAVDPVGRFFVSGSLDLSGKVWDLKTGELLKTLTWYDTPSSMVIDPTGSYVLLSGLDGTAKIWDIEKDEPVQILQADMTVPARLTPEQWAGFYIKGRDNTIAVNAVAMDKQGKYAFTGSQDGTVKVWNTENNEHLSFLAAKDEWLVYTPDGYFDASRRGGDRVLIVKGLSPYAIDQFAVRNNRPDIILQRLQLGGDGLIDHFYRQYVKRLTRLNLAEKKMAGDVHAPEARVLGIEQQGKFADVAFALKDARYRLARYNIYVNDVPLFGAYGNPVSAPTFTHTERIELNSGNNKIEVSCMNEQGAESYRAITNAEYKAPVAGDLYYIGFGVSKYRNRSLNLRYADKDAKDLAAVLEKKRTGFKAVHVKTFVNEEVTAASIKKAKNLLQNASVDDTVVLFAAGHGVQSRDATATYYYLTHDADLGDIASTAADFDLLEELLQGIAPRKKLFLLDTCESGEMDDDVEQGRLASSVSRGLLPRITRAITANPKSKKSRPVRYERDRYIYNDLVRRSGAVVLASSRGNELSYESDAVRNGYFTKEIINAWTGTTADKDSDGLVSTDELRAHVEKAVAAATSDLQHPTIDRDNISIRIALPLEGSRQAALSSGTYRVTVQDFGIVQSESLPARYAPGTALGRTRPTTMDSLRLIDRNDRIKATLGGKFGVFYTVDGGMPNTLVRLTVKVVHPPTKNPAGDVLNTVDQWNAYPRSGVRNYDGWQFEYDWEMVAGTWTFEFYYEGTKIGEKTFTVYR